MDIKYQGEHFNFKGNKWETQDNETMKGCDSKGNSFIIDKDDYNYVKSYCWLRAKGRSSKQGDYFLR